MKTQNMVKTIRSSLLGEGNFSKEIDGIEYFIRIKDSDRYSLVISEVGMVNNQAKDPINREQFESKVKELEKRLSSFMEQPKLIEINPQEQIAQMRSYPPETEQESVKYYELFFSKGKRINFYRIENQKGKKEKIAMILPDHLLEKLINDFTQVIKG